MSASAPVPLKWTPLSPSQLADLGDPLASTYERIFRLIDASPAIDRTRSNVGIAWDVGGRGRRDAVVHFGINPTHSQWPPANIGFGACGYSEYGAYITNPYRSWCGDATLPWARDSPDDCSQSECNDQFEQVVRAWLNGEYCLRVDSRGSCDFRWRVYHENTLLREYGRLLYPWWKQRSIRWYGDPDRIARLARQSFA